MTAQARDTNNSLAENFTGNVDLNAAAAGGSNFNGGQQTVAAVGGVAAFANLVLNTAANGYTVTASAAGLTSGISNAFNVTGDGEDSDADSLELELSQSVVGAGSTITITAIVRDTLGDPITPLAGHRLSDPGRRRLLRIAAGGGRRSDPDTSSDTRGGFVLHGTVNGTTVTGDVIFAVTPNAAQSANAGKFAALALAEGTVALKLDELTDAFDSGNMGAIPAINAALQAARNSIVVTGRHAIQRSRPVAPEIGFLPSLGQLDAARLRRNGRRRRLRSAHSADRGEAESDRAVLQPAPERSRRWRRQFADRAESAQRRARHPPGAAGVARRHAARHRQAHHGDQQPDSQHDARPHARRGGENRRRAPERRARERRPGPGRVLRRPAAVSRGDLAGGVLPAPAAGVLRHARAVCRVEPADEPGEPDLRTDHGAGLAHDRDPGRQCPAGGVPESSRHGRPHHRRQS